VAIRVNEAAMGPTERPEYQAMLRQSFDGMLERLAVFFDGERFLPVASAIDHAGNGLGYN
jgi:hypothetical protein